MSEKGHKKTRGLHANDRRRHLMDVSAALQSTGLKRPRSALRTEKPEGFHFADVENASFSQACKQARASKERRSGLTLAGY